MPDGFVQALAGAYRRSRVARRIGSRAWAQRLLDHGAPECPARAASATGLELTDLGLAIEPTHAFALRAYGNLWDLKAVGFALRARDDGEIEAENARMRVRIQSVEEAFILQEIHCARTYDVAPAENALVIDIGMNAGFASLFFASELPGAQVHGFEPSGSTFARASTQLGLNPGLASRIQPHPFGLWHRDEEMEVEYSPRSRGSSGIWGVARDLPSHARDDVRKEVLKLRDAASVLGPILQSAEPGRPVVLKIDCEGAEYAIFRRLAEAGLADRFDAILMEWHRFEPAHDPLALRRLLSGLGYGSVCLDHPRRTFGMMYAFRRAAVQPARR